MKKRFWACFLSLSLVLTMMPTMAFAADDEVNEPEGTVEVCVETEGCTLEASHEGECVVVESEPEEPESAPCKVTEGCTLENGHEGECVVAESEPEEPESVPCTVTEGCTLEDGHEGECAVASNQTDDNRNNQFIGDIDTMTSPDKLPLVQQTMNTIEEIANTAVQNLYVNNIALVLDGKITENVVEGVSYDADENILYLENVNITYGYTYKDTKTAGIYADGDLNIVLSETNGISREVDRGIYVTGDLTILGKGNLESDVSGIGIYAGSLQIQSTGSINLTADSTCLYSSDGNIDIHSGKLSLTATSNTWAQVIYSAQGLNIGGGDIMISAPVSDEATYTYGVYVNNGNIVIENATITSEAKQDSFYVKGDFITNSGTVYAPNGIRAQGGGSVLITGGNLEVAGKGIEAVNNLYLLDGTINFAGDKLFAYYTIFVDDARINLDNGLTKLKLQGTTYVLNTIEGFNYELYSGDISSSLGYNSKSIAYISDNNKQDQVSYFVGSVGKASYARGHFAYADGGEFDPESIFDIEKKTLVSPKKQGCIFEGWYDNVDIDGDKQTSYTGGKTYYAKWTECGHSAGAEYTALDAVIMKKCSECDAVLATATLTIPSDLVYNSDTKSATVNKTGEWGNTIFSDISYTKDGVSTVPADAGTYTASITIEGATATVDFTIEKAPTSVGITATPIDLTGGGTVTLTVDKSNLPQNAVVSVSGYSNITDNSNGIYTVTLPNETADYTFTATYEGDRNHEAAQDTCTVSVTRHTGGGGASHPEASDDSSSNRNDRDDDDTENIDEEDVPLTEGKVADFDDVPADAWFAEAVQYVYEHDLMTGVSENLFAPNAQMNRAMVAQILFNVEKPADTEAPAAFRDVAADQWYAKAVNWAVWQGYMSGYGAGSFGPNDALTREQLVTVLWRYSGSPVMGDSSMLNTFSDAAMTSDYAQQAMTWAYAQGVISGNADGTLNPQGTATRAEVATILMRFYENMAE